MKITDPEAPLPVPAAAAQLRVLLPEGARYTDLRDKLLANDIETRQVRHLVEDETIVETSGRVTASAWECHVARPAQREFPQVSGAPALAAQDAFRILWDTHSPVATANSEPVRVERVVPSEWLRYLPHPTFNPAQAEAIPHVLERLLML